MFFLFTIRTDTPLKSTVTFLSWLDHLLMMRLVVFLLLVIVCCCDIQVLTDRNGEYNITINDQIWLRSSRTGIYADDRWYSTEDKSLSLIDIRTAQGMDPSLGSWNETKLIYHLIRDQKTISVVARIRQWNIISALTFYLETGNTSFTSKKTLEQLEVRWNCFVYSILNINFFQE